MIVGICKLDVVLDGQNSLKEKRKVLRKIKDSTLSKFKILLSEVDHHDLWQRAGFGFAIVGNSKQNINSLIDRIKNYISELGVGHIVNSEYEFIYF